MKLFDFENDETTFPMFTSEGIELTNLKLFKSESNEKEDTNKEDIVNETD